MIMVARRIGFVLFGYQEYWNDREKRRGVGGGGGSKY